jgi:tetratricopeptide (TPR) repeat protein
VKSLGTITACFPYVDVDTRSVLHSFMERAKDYDHFAEQLCERVLTEEVPDLLVYFTYFHAYNQNKHNLIVKLVDAQISSDLTKPFELTVAARRGEPVEWTDLQKAIAAALRMTKNDWMTCHIYIAWRTLVQGWFPETATESVTLDMLETKIENDEEYNFFLSYLHRIKAKQFQAEGKIDDARVWYDSAISLTKKHDDLEQLAILLQEKANMIKYVNINEALSILKVQREVCEQLGYVDGLALNTHILGHISAVRGEIDESIHLQNEYLNSRKSLGLPVGGAKCLIAMLYNQKHDGKTALDLITDGMNEIIPNGMPMAQAQKAWALLLLNRSEESVQSLDRAKELALRFGNESDFIWTYFVEGVIESQRREYSSAIFSFEKALEIAERKQALPSVNMLLLLLTDIEIETFPYEMKDTKIKTSGPWMQRLMDHLKQRDLPGIAAQSLLLEAKFRFKQGHTDESRKLLQKVLKTSANSNMPYLKDIAKIVLPDLFVS